MCTCFTPKKAEVGWCSDHCCWNTRGWELSDSSSCRLLEHLIPQPEEEHTGTSIFACGVWLPDQRFVSSGCFPCFRKFQRWQRATGMLGPQTILYPDMSDREIDVDASMSWFLFHILDNIFGDFLWPRFRFSSRPLRKDQVQSNQHLPGNQSISNQQSVKIIYWQPFTSTHFIRPILPPNIWTPPIGTVALLLDLFHFTLGRWDYKVPSKLVASDSWCLLLMTND